MQNNLYFNDLNKSQLIELVENYDVEIIRHGQSSETVEEFLEHEKNRNASYLVCPVRFIDDKLKEQFIPQHIIEDSILDIIEDVSKKYINISISETLNGSQYDELNDRISNTLNIYKNSIYNEVLHDIKESNKNIIDSINNRFKQLSSSKNEEE